MPLDALSHRTAYTSDRAPNNDYSNATFADSGADESTDTCGDELVNNVGDHAASWPLSHVVQPKQASQASILTAQLVDLHEQLVGCADRVRFHSFIIFAPGATQPTRERTSTAATTGPSHSLSGVWVDSGLLRATIGPKPGSRRWWYTARRRVVHR